MGKSVILFDGVCNLCNALVNFIIDRDRKEQFYFASLQSETGRRIAAECGLGAEYLDSLVLVDGANSYLKSAAALRIAAKLGGAWRLVLAFYCVPGFIRDFFYGFVAQHRYHWFGKRKSCRVPTPELKNRFLP